MTSIFNVSIRALNSYCALGGTWCSIFTGSSAERDIMRKLGIILLSLLFIGAVQITLGQSNISVYSDSLKADWQDWSWDSTVNFAATTLVQSGTKSLSVKYNQPWAGLYLRLTGAPLSSGYGRVRFWINGGATGGQGI